MNEYVGRSILARYRSILPAIAGTLEREGRRSPLRRGDTKS